MAEKKLLIGITNDPDGIWMLESDAMLRLLDYIRGCIDDAEKEGIPAFIIEICGDCVQVASPDKYEVQIKASKTEKGAVKND